MSLMRNGPLRSDPYFQEWAVVVGDRIRRLRNERGWSLVDLARRITKPEGGYYSAGYFSRFERGASSPPLYAYLRIADELDVEPGLLLGPDEVQRALTPEQAVLLSFLERAGIDSGDAIARLAGAVAAEPT